MTAAAAGEDSPLGKAIDEADWSRFQIFVLVLVSLAFIIEGLTNQLISLSVPALMKAWNLPREPFALPLAVGLVGVAAGNALGGMIGDRIGRRGGVIWPIVVIGFMNFATALSSDLTALTLVRLAAGLGLGALIPNCATLVAEFTPQRRRAFAVAFSLLFVPLGIVAAGVLASAILPAYGWRALSVAGGVIPLFAAVFFWFMLPESPRWLVRDSRNSPRLHRLLERMGVQLTGPAGAPNAKGARQKHGLSYLFAPQFRRDTLCLWGMGFFAYMTSYIILNWAPAMLAGQGLGLDVTSRSLSAWSLGGFGSPLIGLAIQRFGSRRALGGFSLTAAAGTFLLMSLPLNSQQILWFMAMLLVENIFVVGLLGAVYVLATHIYPPAFRSTGTGAASAFGRLGAMTSAYAGVYSLHLGGPAGYFACMTATSLLTFAFAMAIRNHVPAAAITNPGYWARRFLPAQRGAHTDPAREHIA
ncbi:MAG TPA: MFS transporter [Micropepsaceae bacterium]|nr:MFS transporter [Micropepsaceae bacterium]